MELVDRATGKRVQVADDQAAAAFRSGQYGVPKGKPVPVVGEDGTVSLVQSHELAEAFRQGARPASPEEYRKADLQERYGSPLDTAGAAGIGFARGLTFGVSDPLLVKAGGERARTLLAESKEAHPLATTGGEVAGVVAPMLIPGAGEAEAPLATARLARLAAEGAEGARVVGEGAGLVERGANLFGRVLGAAPRTTAELGGLAERAVARVVGEGSTNLATRLGQKALAKGASGAIETSLFSAGQELSEDTLGNHEVNAEKLMAAGLHGALLGGALGGVAGLGGELLGTAGKTVLGKVSPKMEELAEEQAFRAINPRKKFTQLAERAGGTRAVGRTLLDQGLVSAGDDVEAIAPKLTAKRAEVGEQLGGMLDRLDTLGGEGPSVARILERTQKEILAPLEKMPGYESITSGVKGYLESFAAKAESEGGAMGYRRLGDMRKGLDDLIYRGSNVLSPSPLVQELRGIRRILESELETSGEKAAAHVGGSFLDEYKTAKKLYSHLAVADDAAQDAVSRATANRAVSPSDYLVGAAGLVGGGPLGLVKGAALGALHNVVRERGNATMAVWLDKLSTLAQVRRAAVRVDEQVDSAIGGFFGRKTEREAVRVRSFRGVNDEEYQGRTKRLAEHAGNPEALRARVAEQAEGIAHDAPKTTSALGMVAARASAFLASKMPVGHESPGVSLQPQFVKKRLSDQERATFAQYMDAVDAPTDVLHDLREGKLTRPQVEALQQVYPLLYSEIRGRVMNELSEAKTPLDYQKRLQLGLLLDLPADATLEPDFIARVQAQYAPVHGQGPSHPHPSGGGAGVKAIAQTATPFAGR